HVFDAAGTHRLTALADTGAWTSIGFRVLVPDTGGGAAGGGDDAGARPSAPAPARVQPPSASSTCSALETLNSPGASTNRCLTTPSSAWRAKRLRRMPTP